MSSLVFISFYLGIHSMYAILAFYFTVFSLCKNFFSILFYFILFFLAFLFSVENSIPWMIIFVRQARVKNKNDTKTNRVHTHMPSNHLWTELNVNKRTNELYVSACLRSMQRVWVFVLIVIFDLFWFYWMQHEAKCHSTRT